MRESNRATWRGSAVVLLTLGALTGCPAKRELGPTPRTVEEAVDRVNENLAAINAPLYCKPATVSFSFRDEKGATRDFKWHPATVIYRQPRDLYFDIKSALDVGVARVGSNDDRYWFWIDVGDTKRLWFGKWAALGNSAPRRLPIPPNDLLDALMLRPLPRSLAGGILPMLRVEGSDHRLIYPRLDDFGDRNGYREITLDPYTPQQPIEVVDRDRNGQVLMRAKMSDYKRIRIGDSDSGPYSARKYKVEWPATGAKMDLDLEFARFRPDQSPVAWEFPEDWQGESENLDDKPPPAEPQ